MVREKARNTTTAVVATILVLSMLILDFTWSGFTPSVFIGSVALIRLVNGAGWAGSKAPVMSILPWCGRVERI
jgi:hypothetical protein